MILPDQILAKCSINSQDGDTGLQGGGIDKARKPVFKRIETAGNIQIVSDNGADTSQDVTVTGLDPTGIEMAEAKTLTGLTPVPMTVNTNWDRLWKAIKSAVTAGNVAVETVIAKHSGTAQGGGARTPTALAYVQLAAGASNSDGAYDFHVIRIESGTGAGQIRQCLNYLGGTRRANIYGDWATVPDATSVVRVSAGMVFDLTPDEIMECRRICYSTEAEAAGGSQVDVYEKVHFLNTHPTLAFTNAQIIEHLDAEDVFTFGLAPTLDDTATVADRRTAPGGITFDNNPKAVPNSGNHTAGTAVAVWLKLALPAGAATANTELVMRENGRTI